MQTLITILFPYILPLLILSIPLLFVWRKPKSELTDIKVPPGSTGWPVIGDTVQFLFSGPENFISERRKKYSEDVFQTSLFGQRVAVFCGAQGNKFVFSKVINSWWPHSIRKLFQFPEFVDTPINEVSALMHSYMNEVLKPEALKQYIPVMDSMAREQVKSEWDGNEAVNVYPLSKKYTFDLAIRLFVNVVDGDHVTRLFKHFTLVAHGLFSVPINLPGTTYNLGIKGGRLVREELVKIITERRNKLMDKKETSSESTDSLSRIVLMTDKNGNFMSEKEICNSIIGLVVASYEPTSSSVTFVLKYLAELPHIYNEVYKGPKMCPGREYARLEILVFIYNIVTKYKLEIINPQEKIVFRSFPIPKEGLPLGIIRHTI